MRGLSTIPKLENYLRYTIATALFPLTCTQALWTQYDRYRYKPAGQHISIGSRELHAHVTGNGKTTIVMEAGMGGNLLDWSLVQPELSRDATVVTYDRAGLGWSEGSDKPATCQQYVDDLRSLLAALELQPPYVLVGHSFGGMVMRLFAAEYPDEVKSLILVDAVHEGRYLATDMLETGQRNRDSLNQLRLGYLLSPTAIPRLAGRHIGSRRLPPPMLEQVKAAGYRNSAYKAIYAELLDAHESALQLATAEPLRVDLPIVVLSAGQQDKEWHRGQLQLAELTSRTQHIVVRDSWHSIQIYRPDVVIDAIRSLL
ncbi:alpha/beta fold hydrolase [Paenibacillus sp. GCM10012306]|uniref:alpha/beta fold hydrolase n=1 Tax=Paenibacillus sp. GCM10012306 TaxID=3317342 RepID=UPI00360BC371